MAEEKKDYTHVKKALQKYKSNTEFLDTLKHHHSKAYVHAADEVLVDENGTLKIERLKDAKYQRKMADAMADFYLDKAKAVMKADPSDDRTKELLMQAYTGATKTELRKIVQGQRENFTHEYFHLRLAPGLVRQVENRIEDIPYADLKEEHKTDIIEHITKESGTPVKDWVDTSNMSLEDATKLLESFADRGGVLEKEVEGTPFFKKKEKKKAA
jgi:hypothetical protein